MQFYPVSNDHDPVGPVSQAALDRARMEHPTNRRRGSDRRRTTSTGDRIGTLAKCADRIMAVISPYIAEGNETEVANVILDLLVMQEVRGDA